MTESDGEWDEKNFQRWKFRMWFRQKLDDLEETLK
jgi:hypothetical protein